MRWLRSDNGSGFVVCHNEKVFVCVFAGAQRLVLGTVSGNLDKNLGRPQTVLEFGAHGPPKFRTMGPKYWPMGQHFHIAAKAGSHVFCRLQRIFFFSRLNHQKKLGKVTHGPPTGKTANFGESRGRSGFVFQRRSLDNTTRSEG